MRQLVWSSTFIRSYKRHTRKNPSLLHDIGMVLELLVANPFAASLETHKLKGSLSGVWACSVSRNLRVLFEFRLDPVTNGEEIFLIAIGTHDEVY